MKISTNVTEEFEFGYGLTDEANYNATYNATIYKSKCVSCTRFDPRCSACSESKCLSVRTRCSTACAAAATGRLTRMWPLMNTSGRYAVLYAVAFTPIIVPSLHASEPQFVFRARFARSSRGAALRHAGLSLLRRRGAFVVTTPTSAEREPKNLHAGLPGRPGVVVQLDECYAPGVRAPRHPGLEIAHLLH